MTLDFPPPPTRETTWDARLWELTYCYGTSFKFYRAYLLTSTEGQARVLLNWGRIDTAGQSRVILYDTADEAAADVDRITTSKHRKGYDWENVSAPVEPDEQLLRLAGIDQSTTARSPQPEVADELTGFLGHIAALNDRYGGTIPSDRYQQLMDRYAELVQRSEDTARRNAQDSERAQAAIAMAFTACTALTEIKERTP
jgi:predicted DNA-binding WGR domain protein